jgi:4-amino-4-deoxy-L-arabinose transferase-like glycosyltransferase
MPKIYKVSLIIFVLAVYCFAFQGQRALFDPDEGRYSAVALQMIKSSDWLHPRTHPDHEHWTKPPLTYWAIARSLLFFGHNEFAVRFPNVLSFFLTVITSYYLGKIFLPQRPWLVALVFATFLFPATICNGATTDFPVTLWETLAVCFFAHAFWLAKDKQQTVFVLLSWVSFGLAFLTKGPPGLLPLLAVIIFLQQKCARKNNFNMRWLQGFLLMLLVGGSWFLMVIFEKRDLLQYFLWEEIVLRVFTGHHERHSHWYAFLYIYFPVLIFGTLPWSYYTGQGLVNSWKKAKASLSVHTEENTGQSLFLMLWFLVPLSIFMVSRSNLPLYVLPLFAPLAVITASAAQNFDFSLKKNRYMIVAWCAVIVLQRIVMGAVPFKKDASRFAQAIKNKYPPAVEEMLFVNAKPILGLQFYTGADIAGVPLDAAEVEKKLKTEKSCLWFVLKNDAEEFRGLVARHALALEEIGPAEAQQSYIFFRELDGKLK